MIFCRPMSTKRHLSLETAFVINSYLNIKMERGGLGQYSLTQREVDDMRKEMLD